MSSFDDAGMLGRDPRLRQRSLALFLRAAAGVTFVLAALALVPGGTGRLARGAMFVVLVFSPLVRVGWLAVRWSRRGDRLFAAVAAIVLAVGAVGAALAGA